MVKSISSFYFPVTAELTIMEPHRKRALLINPWEKFQPVTKMPPKNLSVFFQHWHELTRKDDETAETLSYWWKRF